MKDCDKIKLLRTSQGLTQKEFAGKIGLTKQYISLLESQLSPISNSVKHKIIENFGLPYNYFMEESECLLPTQQASEEIVLSVDALNTLNSFITELNKCTGKVRRKAVNPEYNKLTDRGKVTIDNIIHALLIQEQEDENNNADKKED